MTNHMDKLDFYTNQGEKRTEYLDLILKSNSRRKLIVSGPGTGKTYTFKEIFKSASVNNNLALTFIRKLVEDMSKDLGDLAEVKTFHAFCKKLLHERMGKVELVPFLTKIIEADADLLGYGFKNFDDKFQTLEESSRELAFYLDRGDYYNAVSFNDSVYRLLKYVRENIFVLPAFNQVVIDEFQDFNPLEVAFIEELEKKSPILIVGDDDQAVYVGRNSSPEHLRRKYHSGDYEIFQLPYCSRCPKVIVEATAAFIENAVAKGGLRERIARPFYPFLEDKQEENNIFPKIIKATTTTIDCLHKFIASEIQQIPSSEINEAVNKDYPCVLIVGKRQYLNPLAKRLREQFSNVNFTEAQEISYSIIDGYELLRTSADANLGWRILAEFEFPSYQMREFIRASLFGTPMTDILPKEFLKKHEMIIKMLISQQIDESDREKLSRLIGNMANEVVNHFFPKETVVEQEPNKSQPTILLSSFEGCKGLSAGRVFIVGLNDRVVPKYNFVGNVEDIEFCKFIVALTRTRKQCYLLSNLWDYNPREKKRYEISPFVRMIPSKFICDKGNLRSSDIKSKF